MQKIKIIRIVLLINGMLGTPQVQTAECPQPYPPATRGGYPRAQGTSSVHPTLTLEECREYLEKQLPLFESQHRTAQLHGQDSFRTALFCELQDCTRSILEVLSRRTLCTLQMGLYRNETAELANLLNSYISLSKRFDNGITKSLTLGFRTEDAEAKLKTQQSQLMVLTFKIYNAVTNLKQLHLCRVLEQNPHNPPLSPQILSEQLERVHNIIDQAVALEQKDVTLLHLLADYDLLCQAERQLAQQLEQKVEGYLQGTPWCSTETPATYRYFP